MIGLNTLRVIMAELQRIASHLLGLGAFGLDVGAFTPFLHMLRDRERILDLFEMTCGARLLYNYMWVGGLSHDLPVGFVESTYNFLDYFEPKIDEFVNLLVHNKIFVERTADIGRMPQEVAVSYGVTGPNLRASGVKWDLRKNDPYSIYKSFEFDVPVGEGGKGSVGDCWDRFYVRVLEMKESIKILRQALASLTKRRRRSSINTQKRFVLQKELYIRGLNLLGEILDIILRVMGQYSL